MARKIGKPLMLTILLFQMVKALRGILNKIDDTYGNHNTTCIVILLIVFATARQREMLPPLLIPFDRRDHLAPRKHNRENVQTG